MSKWHYLVEMADHAFRRVVTSVSTGAMTRDKLEELLSVALRVDYVPALFFKSSEKEYHKYIVFGYVHAFHKRDDGGTHISFNDLWSQAKARTRPRFGQDWEYFSGQILKNDYRLVIFDPDNEKVMWHDGILDAPEAKIRPHLSAHEIAIPKAEA